MSIRRVTTLQIGVGLAIALAALVAPLDLYSSGEFLEQLDSLRASNREYDDQFGFSVAADADTLVVGAWNEDSAATGVNGNEYDNSISRSGAAYVFFRDESGWVQQAYLKASNAGSEDHFGASVAISGDTIVVGAPFEWSAATGVNGDQNDNSFPQAGAAYVFRRTGEVWVQEAYLKASNPGDGDHFGFYVAISGNTIVVGAQGENSVATGVNGDQGDNSLDQPGAAYVFVRNGSAWSQQAYLKASNTDAGDNFGAGVAIFGDTILIGAPGEDSESSGVDGNQQDNSLEAAGAVYVFGRDGEQWSQQAYLKASNPSLYGVFGHRLAISGETAIVSSYNESSSATGVNGDQSNQDAQYSGAAYVFVRDVDTWWQEAYLKASNTDASDGFGSSLALHGDWAVIGAQGEGSISTGINGDESDNSFLAAGAAYLFKRSSTGWSQHAYLKAYDTENRAFFGNSASIAGNMIYLGSLYAAGRTGKVYPFEIMRSPEDILESLIEFILSAEEAGYVPHGLVGSLTSILETTLKGLDKGKTKNACNSVNAFLALIYAQYGTLDHSVTDHLLAEAQSVKILLGCK